MSCARWLLAHCPPAQSAPHRTLSTGTIHKGVSRLRPSCPWCLLFRRLLNHCKRIKTKTTAPPRSAACGHSRRGPLLAPGPRGVQYRCGSQGVEQPAWKETTTTFRLPSSTGGFSLVKKRRTFRMRAGQATPSVKEDSITKRRTSWAGFQKVRSGGPAETAAEDPHLCCGWAPASLRRSARRTRQRLQRRRTQITRPRNERNLLLLPPQGCSTLPCPCCPRTCQANHVASPRPITCSDDDSESLNWPIAACKTGLPVNAPSQPPFTISKEPAESGPELNLRRFKGSEGAYTFRWAEFLKYWRPVPGPTPTAIRRVSRNDRACFQCTKQRSESSV